MRHIVLVAVTGYGQPEDRRLAAAAGFDEHIVKPITLEMLRRAMGRAGAAGPTPPERRSRE